MRQNINDTMISIALVMSGRSTCARRKVGAVITSIENQILSTGYNGVPRGWNHCTDTPCKGANSPSGKDLDLCEAVHAEANAIAQCANIAKAHNIYVTTMCCVSCCKLLLNTNVQNIYYIETYPQHAATANLWVRGGRKLISISEQASG
jgi:dCMP deaminase